MNSVNDSLDVSVSGNLRGKRSYSVEVKERAVRMVLKVRSELGSKKGTVKRVADQLGVHPETLRVWVRQAEIDAGGREGVTSEQSEAEKVLRQELKELRRANEILKAASVFFATELDGHQLR